MIFSGVARVGLLDVAWHVRRDHAVTLAEAGQIRLPHVAGEGSGVKQEQGLALAMRLVVDVHAIGCNDVTSHTAGGSVSRHTGSLATGVYLQSVRDELLLFTFPTPDR